ncbi:MAG: sulfate adenylyltransferase subunit CysN [Tetrasphaera sp.]
MTTTDDSIYQVESLIAEDIDAYLERHQHKTMLRFITCGSVDDGKSTLIGRMLYDSKMIFEDHLQALEADSKRVGTQGDQIDFALLVDGLAAEREQGITIDVAYRFFSTEKRKFIVADTPGHEQYTRNMVTGASTAELAVILIDARKGVLTQTRRHSYLTHLIGIRHIVLAVNKMDLVGYSQQVFDDIVADYRAFADSIGIGDFTAIPISGFLGDNITTNSSNAPWYTDTTLMNHLETVELDQTLDQQRPFRMPVQRVTRPDLNFRGFAGTIANGVLRPGDQVRVLPSNRSSTVARIVTFDGDLQEAVVGQAVTVTLADEIDCSRGDVLVLDGDVPESADHFECHLVWMDDSEMLPGRPYWIKIGTTTVTAQFERPKYQVNVNTMEHAAAKTLDLNAIGVVTFSTDRPIVFEPYAQSHDLGGFIVIDKMTNATVAAGMIHFALRRAKNVSAQPLEISRQHHARMKNQDPAVIWLTGVPGSGKTQIANELEVQLARMNRHTFLILGENMRLGLSKDLGFDDADRVENARRLAEVAKLMADAGLVVIVSSISPFTAERRMARDLIGESEFYEVFVDMPLAEAEKRDTKGLYAAARAGELTNYTGVDSQYEAPTAPEVRIDALTTSAKAAAAQIVALLIP